MPAKHDLMGGPKRQFNLRMPVTLRAEIGDLASARGMKPSQVALGLLEEAVVNRCRRCHGGMAPGGTPLHPKPCRFCSGTGRLDIVMVERRMRSAATGGAAALRRASVRSASCLQ
jgi:hypothetical protein